MQAEMGRRKNCSHSISTRSDVGPGWQIETGGVCQTGGQEGTWSRGGMGWVISEAGNLPALWDPHSPHDFQQTLCGPWFFSPSLYLFLM